MCSEPSAGLEPTTPSLPWASEVAAKSALCTVHLVIGRSFGPVDYRVLRIFGGRFGRGSESAAFSRGAARTVWSALASLMHVVRPASVTRSRTDRSFVESANECCG